MKETEVLSEEKSNEDIEESLDEENELQVLKAENERLRALLDSFTQKEEDEVVYKRSDWGNKLLNFLSKYPEAKNCAKEISEALMSFDDGAKSEDALERAYISVLSRKKSPEELIDDEDFLSKYVYLSKKIKDKIIADYVSEMEKGAPSVIAKGGEVFLSPPKKPRTLNEAMRLAEKLLS